MVIISCLYSNLRVGTTLPSPTLIYCKPMSKHIPVNQKKNDMKFALFPVFIMIEMVLKCPKNITNFLFFI